MIRGLYYDGNLVVDSFHDNLFIVMIMVSSWESVQFLLGIASVQTNQLMI